MVAYAPVAPPPPPPLCLRTSNVLLQDQGSVLAHGHVQSQTVTKITSGALGWGMCALSFLTVKHMEQVNTEGLVLSRLGCSAPCKEHGMI